MRRKLTRSRIRARPSVLTGLTMAAALSAGLGVLPTAAVAFAMPAPPSPGTAPATVSRACADTRAGHAHCWAMGRDDAHGGQGVLPAAPSGYGPSDIKSAYNLPDGGDGVTVAIVDAYDDPRAESDLATYRKQHGLPACITANGCFRKTDHQDLHRPPPLRGHRRPAHLQRNHHRDRTDSYRLASTRARAEDSAKTG